MVTKEQALECNAFYINNNGKSYLWRANGKCKVWKTRPNDFKLPIKHGLYAYGYITQDNAYQFEVVS